MSPCILRSFDRFVREARDNLTKSSAYQLKFERALRFTLVRLLLSNLAASRRSICWTCWTSRPTITEINRLTYIQLADRFVHVGWVVGPLSGRERDYRTEAGQEMESMEMFDGIREPSARDP